MKIYLVGGAVRDKLLGLTIKERDWVVVGATIDQMLNLGYQQVGKEFPVFLHPQTHEEYALARIERKIQPGYKGFIFHADPHVSLKDDLKRRDLTINAMAETLDGELIDPFHGQDDLNQKILRHVSPAFIEDPVRILRVARFMARYGHLGFHIANETLTLMQTMVKAGEVDALVAERVWKELYRALLEKNPEFFFAVLDQCGALIKLFPQLYLKKQGIEVLKKATSISTHATIRFAALLHDLPNPKVSMTALAKRYRIPNEYKELALITANHYQTVLNITMHAASAASILEIFYSLDMFRREKRFNDFLLVCQAIAHTHTNYASFDMMRWKKCATVAKHYDVQLLLQQGLSGLDLAQALRRERQAVLEEMLGENR